MLCELVNDRSCAEFIAQQNCTPVLTDLLKCNDEIVGECTSRRWHSTMVLSTGILATYAAAVLFRLSDDKPNDASSTFYREEHSVKNVRPTGMTDTEVFIFVLIALRHEE